MDDLFIEPLQRVQFQRNSLTPAKRWPERESCLSAQEKTGFRLALRLAGMT
jgi:hypothetical protein